VDGKGLQFSRALGRRHPHADAARREADRVRGDITYGTNNEFGFDYLRDNMAMQVGDRFQPG